MAGINVIFVFNDIKLSSCMAQISEHISSSNHKIHSYNQMSKMIINLDSNKSKNNNNFTCQLSCLQN